MKKVFILFLSVFILEIVSCSVDTNEAADVAIEAETVSPGINFTYEGKSVNITVYSRNAGDTRNHPVFKYGDLINRAINYKTENPSISVIIKFAIYKIGENSYIGFDPSDTASYGYVKGSDHGGAYSEKLIYSIARAAYNQVYVDFVYHKDVSGNTESYLSSFMNNSCYTDPLKKVGDYLRVRKISWGSESYQQMHSKFMTVSHYASDNSSLISDTVYITTTNIDDFDNEGLPVDKDWVQSGMLINGHPELKDSFDNYFNIIFDNYNSQSNFHTAVRSAHAANSLNYDDYHFSSYFYPIPENPAGNYTPGDDGGAANGNGWDTGFNPVAKYVEMMALTSGSRYLKTDVYHLKMDNFGKKFYDRLEEIYNVSDGDTKSFKFVVNTNTYENTYPLINFNNIGTIKEPRPTHAKDSIFAMSGIQEYFTITGSANFKLDAYCSKANNSLVVKEYTTEHPVYNEYKAIFEYQY